MDPSFGTWIFILFGLAFFVILAAIPLWFIIKVIGVLFRSINKSFSDIRR